MNPPEKREYYKIEINGHWQYTDNLTTWQNIKHLLKGRKIKSISINEYLSHELSKSK